MKPAKAAMIIAHPGHELRVHHWVETVRPEVVVLTDGSGRTNQSRLPSTTKVLRRAGAVPGPVYGRFTDMELYQVMLTGKTDMAINLVQETADWLIAGQFDLVAGDALEGYNTSHEFCRGLTGAACELVRRRTGRSLPNYDFLLTGRPDECPESLRAGAIHLELDAAALARKFAAAENYPELQHEVAAALEKFGKEIFAHEWLRPVANDAGLKPAPEAPFYETYGEKQKAAGHYQHVIRAREHVLPLAQVMWDFASR
jgi:hypothetical protein